jgi:hypothetical protein
VEALISPCTSRTSSNWMPPNSRLSHQSYWLAILVLMPRVPFSRAQLSALVSKAQSSCHPHTLHLHAGCSSVRNPLTALSYRALSKLSKGLGMAKIAVSATF